MTPMPEPSTGERCQECGERPATIKWAGNTLSASHGWHQMWCRVCVLTAQVEYHRRAAERLPQLERELQEAKEDPDA